MGLLISCTEGTYNILSEMHNLSLITKTQEPNPHSTKELAESVKVMKDKKRNGPRSNEAEDTGQLDAM